MSTKILFHSFGNGRHCPDGFAAAWAAWKRYGDQAEYIPCVYQQPAPEIRPGDQVYLLDFSYPRDVLLAWNDIARVKVLDHHKSAQEALEGLPFAEFDMNLSGAQLAWNYFHGGDIPYLISYVADRDLWLKELPFTEQVHRALASFPQNFVVWDGLAEMSQYPEVMRRIGEPMYQAHLAEVEALVATAEVRSCGSYRVLSTNTDKYSLVSDALNLLCQRNPESKFAFNFFEKDGAVKTELRSIGDFDVSEVAKQYGGGGHRNAAGFSLQVKPAWRFDQ